MILCVKQRSTLRSQSLVIRFEPGLSVISVVAVNSIVTDFLKLNASRSMNIFRTRIQSLTNPNQKRDEHRSCFLSKPWVLLLFAILLFSGLQSQFRNDDPFAKMLEDVAVPIETQIAKIFRMKVDPFTQEAQEMNPGVIQEPRAVSHQEVHGINIPENQPEKALSVNEPRVVLHLELQGKKLPMDQPEKVIHQN